MRRSEVLSSWVIRPPVSLYNSHVWPVRTIDYRQLNKKTSPLFSAVPDVVTIAEDIVSRKGRNWDAALELANAFFSIPIPRTNLPLAGLDDITPLLQGYVHSPTLCHGLIAHDPAKVTFTDGVTVSHYIYDILLQGTSEEVVAEALDSLLLHLKSCGWADNPAKVQGPNQSGVFFGVISGKPATWTSQKRPEKDSHC